MLVAEELLLLSIDDAKGTDRSWGAIGAGLRAGILVELGLAKRVTVEGSGADSLITVVDASATSDEILDEKLSELAGSRPSKVTAAVAVPAGLRDELRERLARRLVAAGVLSEQKGKVLGLFGSVRYPEADPAPEREIRSRLENVLVRGAEPDARTAALVSLVSVTGLTTKAVPSADRKVAEQRAKTIADGTALPTAVREANQQLVAITTTIAANAAIISATTTATS